MNEGSFDLRDGVGIGEALRRSCRRDLSIGDVATKVVDLVSRLEHDGQPACLSVRAYVGTGAEDAVLTASRGVDTDPAMSLDLARRLDSGKAGVLQITEVGPFGPPSGVWSILGFGCKAPTDHALAVLAFCRAKADAAIAAAFAIVALDMDLALLETHEVRAALGQRSVDAKVIALEALVGGLTRLPMLTQQPEARAEAGRRESDALRRTQRAMLNVIEDLREARSGLEQKVALRTRELETRNQELEEFAYIASHDLQEPLRTVSGYLQMIERRDKGQLDAEASEFIAFAVDGARRMQALIESLLYYSRLTKQAHTADLVVLDDALDDALQNLARTIEETGARIERETLPSLQADRMHMVQIFQNIVANALKFAGDRPPHVVITAAQEDGMWRIAIRDDGIGFNPRFADRIFKIFRRLQRNTPGTGIGLAVCKKLVERHGGRIDAHSEPGKGSTFTISLPLEGT